MKVRDLEWRDFEPLVENYWHLYDERAAGEPIGITLLPEKPSMAEEVGWFAGLYRRALEKEAIVVVAEEDGRAVGCCTIVPSGPGGLKGETGHVGVLGILIHHRYRGRGAGRAMMVRALEQARDQYEVVSLGVFGTNTRAKELYRSLGFVPSGNIPGGIRRGEARIDHEEMVLDLRGWKPPPTRPNR